MSLTSTWIASNSLALGDTVGNNVLVITDNNSAMRAQNFNQDVTKPQLVSFSLSVNDPAQLALTFSEPVVAGSRYESEIVLQNAASATPSATTRLSTSTSWSSDNSVVTIAIALVELNSIKDQAGLGMSPATTYLSLTGNTVTDIVGNAVTAVTPANAAQAAMYTADTTAPQLTSFLLSRN